MSGSLLQPPQHAGGGGGSRPLLTSAASQSSEGPGPCAALLHCVCRLRFTVGSLQRGKGRRRLQSLACGACGVGGAGRMTNCCTYARHPT